MKKSYDEMAREAEAVKDTGAEMEGLVPVKARVAKPVRSVYSVRLSSQELSEISKAAKRRDMTMSDFMRQASLSKLSRNTSSGFAARSIASRTSGRRPHRMLPRSFHRNRRRDRQSSIHP